MILLIVLIVVFVLYCLSTMGRTGHPSLHELHNWTYAHRGLHGAGAPENSLEAFRRAKEAGYGVELDVHLLADGNLAVMHDSLLMRTTGHVGRIEDLTTEELSGYYLEDSEYTIPLFSDVLKLYDGKAPLIVELKCIGNNYDALCAAACKLLDAYNGPYCMESFDPRCVRWLRKNRPDIVRGQLTEDYFRSETSKIPGLLKFLLKHQMMNFLTMPDFIAYKYCDRKTFSNILCRKLWRLTGVTWTVQNMEEFDTAKEEGWITIFENFTP